MSLARRRSDVADDCFSSSVACSAYQPQQEQQHDGPDERDEDHSAESAEWRGGAEGPQQPATYESADDSNDDVADQAVTTAAHDERGEHAGNQSNNEPCENGHIASSR